MRVQHLADMRRAYEGDRLDDDALSVGWLPQFERWLQDAVDAGLPEPNAMVLATADTAGRPSARTVLLKDAGDDGLVFFTNGRSRKATQLAANPRASVLFPWIGLQRQVEASGVVEPVAQSASDAYFASRPRGSQLGAAASPQSAVIADRSVLECARDQLADRYPEGTPVPRPAHWGGLRLVPDQVEFWQGRPNRLHDRLRFRRTSDGSWVRERLAP
jgi:pyridoxamine 5'-phosphate oxidase